METEKSVKTPSKAINKTPAKVATPKSANTHSKVANKTPATAASKTPSKVASKPVSKATSKPAKKVTKTQTKASGKTPSKTANTSAKTSSKGSTKTASSPVKATRKSSNLSQFMKKIADWDTVEYFNKRKGEAQSLGVRVDTLDAIAKVSAAAGSELSSLPYPVVTPYKDPIEPATLLNEITETIHRFIVLDNQQTHAVALWIAFTWFIDEVATAPLLIIGAPDRACGKTELLDIVKKLANRPIVASNITPPVLFRLCENFHPTLLADEIDTFIKSSPQIAGLINAGHTRTSAFVYRLDKTQNPTAFNVWGAKALAGIMPEKHLPEATMSRGIVLKLRRKLPHETAERQRGADMEIFEVLASKLARFAKDYSTEVKKARPPLPDAISDRAQDNWEPLLAIAGCASEEWLARATAAALNLSNKGEKIKSVGEELLADIRRAFEDSRVERISNNNLIKALCKIEESSWSTFKNGRQIDVAQVTKLLLPYEVRSKALRFENGVSRGYELSQFEDAFARYLPGVPVTTVTPLQANTDKGLSTTSQKTGKVKKTTSVTPKAT